MAGVSATTLKAGAPASESGAPSRIHPLAGKPAPRDVLVDVGALRREYYERAPDHADPAQRVSFGGKLSSVGRLRCGVPQGSVLGPLLFVLYTAELFDVIADCGLTAHSYADDTQVYISTPAADAPVAVQRFAACVDRIAAWMGSNRLKLNAEKTQLIWTGTRQQLAKIDAAEAVLLSAKVQFSDCVSDLGVTDRKSVV